jgi:hypothetical protein
VIVTQLVTQRGQSYALRVGIDLFHAVHGYRPGCGREARPGKSSKASALSDVVP